MREIRFRVYDEVSNTLWYPEQGGNYCVTQIGAVCTDPDDDNGPIVNVSYRTKSMLSTRLKDVHGVEIFQGDIVEAWGTVLEIVWVEDDASFFAESVDKFICESGQEFNRNCTVIGNIYQNPELLK